METMRVETWEQFTEELEKLRTNRRELVEKQVGHISDFLFRGHRDACWDLSTTLEREAPHIERFSQYFRLVSIAKSQIESLSPLRWDLDPYPQLEAWAAEYDNPKKGFPGYEYLVYLRHHGFPSPLLDWTRSELIAAYFAFEAAKDEDVAIYIYWEIAGFGKSGSANFPQIVTFGPYTRAHPRHFHQQSAYTLCCEYGTGPWKFAHHERVYGTWGDGQDRIYKFVLPVSERPKVLRLLDKANINPFTLFQSDEGLLRTIATRELVLREREL